MPLPPYLSQLPGPRLICSTQALLFQFYYFSSTPASVTNFNFTVHHANHDLGYTTTVGSKLLLEAGIFLVKLTSEVLN